MEFFRIFLKNSICENLLLYSLNPEEAYKINPSPEKYFIRNPEKTPELKSGIYYFTQVRKEIADNGELLVLAMELQKEGLWNRFKLGNMLYVRSLFEDSSPVTQIWRPILP